MTNAFEYGDALLPPPEMSTQTEGEPTRVESNTPYLNLATYVLPLTTFGDDPYSLHLFRFRMVVLADEVLESFFETDLSASFRLEPVPELELPLSNGGFLGDLWSNIATDTNKKMFHKLTDELGKTIGKHQVRAITPSLCIS